jgi:lysozyme
MSRLTASRAAFDLIASFEGFRTRAVQTGNGKWTLGFGHTATAREGLTVTRAEAEDLLRWDLLPIEDSLRQVALTPLTQNQFDALVSFAFNIGLDNFKKSEVLSHLNQGQLVAAALAMHAWRRAQVNGRLLTIDALVRRRAAEAALFLETQGPRPAAPSPVIVPQAEDRTRVSASAPTSNQDEVAPPAQPPSANLKTTLPSPTSPIAEAPISARPPAMAAASVTDIMRAPLAPELPPIVANDAPALPEVSKGVTREASLPAQTREASPALQPFPDRGPLVPKGLAPFPGAPDYMPANGTMEEPLVPANESSTTRLHATPELIQTPSVADPSEKPAPSPFKINRDSLLIWILMALGAALLAFGLFVSWKSGLLTGALPKQTPSPNDIMAILAAASGFLILTTSAIAALTLNRDPSET